MNQETKMLHDFIFSDINCSIRRASFGVTKVPVFPVKIFSATIRSMTSFTLTGTIQQVLRYFKRYITEPIHYSHITFYKMKTEEEVVKHFSLWTFFSDIELPRNLLLTILYFNKLAI